MLTNNTRNGIPFNDTKRRFIQHEKILSETLLSVAASGHWLFGQQTDIFSKRFAAFCQSTHCIPVGNGTDAIELALRALGCDSPKDQVITVANAGGYTTTACYSSGATPVYVDVSPTNLLIDHQAVLEALNPLTKVVVVTHLYGGVVHVPTLRALLDGAGYDQVAILEDCAQAHGAYLGDHSVGHLGDIAAFSFYPTKNLGCMGDGGAIVTDNTVLYDRVRQLHQYGWSKKYENTLAGGRNSRMDELQAGVLNCLLDHLNTWNKRRRNILLNYRTAASEKLKFLDYETDNHVAHLAIVRTNNRQGFREFMAKQGIATDVHYPILDCDQPGWQRCPKHTGDLNVSRQAINEIVSIPLFPELTDDEIVIVCEALSAWENQ